MIDMVPCDTVAARFTETESHIMRNYVTVERFQYVCTSKKGGDFHLPSGCNRTTD